MLLYQTLAFIIHGKKKSYKNNKFKTSAPTRNEKFELPIDEILCHTFKFILNTS